MHAAPDAMVSPVVAEVVATTTRSCQKATDTEFAATVARLLRANMGELRRTRARFPLGLFAVGKDDGRLRLIVDGRPANVFFLEPPLEHTSGDDLCLIFVDEGFALQAGTVDLADYLHTIATPAAVRSYFGLRPVRASALRALGVEVPEDVVDSGGWTHLYLTTAPMGWKPAPALAQAANEAVVYGELGSGSTLARALPAVLDPAERLSSLRMPPWRGGAEWRGHALVIDDLMKLRTVSRSFQRRWSPQPGQPSSDLARACTRYREVGGTVKEAKVLDYDAKQRLLGYQLEDNVLRTPADKFAELSTAVRELCRRGWAQPREVERILGKFTHLYLLHRPALAVFSAVYAFARKLGHRRARLWPSVRRELRRALALLPLVRAELDRPVCPRLVQTDASSHGAGVVYTSDVPVATLRQECQRPRGAMSAVDEWAVQTTMAAQFEAPTDPGAYRVAVRRRFQGHEISEHINRKELGAVVTAVRWASRAPCSRRCRLVLQADSAVAVGVLRKGRSSRPGLLYHARRLAALTLAHRISLVPRWISTEKNMADRPSRNGASPGPCLPVLAVRPRGSGQGGYAGVCVGEARVPGPPPPFFWSPLLDGRVQAATLDQRYRPAVRAFVRFVHDHGDDVADAEECDYWMAFYLHFQFSRGAQGASKSHCSMALHGVEFWMPQAKPLRLARSCLKGWDKLCPPRPYAPMPRDLVFAVALLCGLAGHVGPSLAVLLSFDCFLRISEVAGLAEGDIVDHRGQADPVGRGVAVYLPITKTGRRQAVLIEDPALADAVVRWKDAVRSQRGAGALLFPSKAVLRDRLRRALTALDDGTWDTRGLSFVWHSLRHGGASRAYLRGGGPVLPDIIVRGRWAYDASARHYIQGGRQLLLSLVLPDYVSDMARRLTALGPGALLAPNLRDLLE
jgi:integrase